MAKNKFPRLILYFFIFLYVSIHSEPVSYGFIDNDLLYLEDSETESDTSKQELFHRLLGLEINFLNFSTTASKLDLIKFSKSFIHTVHQVSKVLCSNLRNSTMNNDVLVTNKTKIQVTCIMSANLSTQLRNVTDDLFWITNEELSGNNKSLKIKLSNEKWRDCERENDEDSNEINKKYLRFNCVGIIHHSLPLQLDELSSVTQELWETITIHPNNNRTELTHSTNIYPDSTTLFQIKILSAISDAKCGRFNESSRIWETGSCNNTNGTNQTNFHCTCSDLGLYKLIYTKSKNGSDPNKWEKSESVSFWIDYKKENNKSMESSKAKFETLLLLQIINQLGYEKAELNKSIYLTTDYVNNSILVALTLNGLHQNKNFISLDDTEVLNNRNKVSQFLFKLEEALEFGKLVLVDLNNRTLEIPPQELKMDTVVEKGSNGSAESTFLWIVFVIVMILTITLMIFAIRKQQREYEDSVQPITTDDFRPMDNDSIVVSMTSPYPCPRDCGSTGRGQGVVSARSMTTILSESMDSVTVGGRKRSTPCNIESLSSLSPSDTRNGGYDMTSRPPPFQIFTTSPDHANESSRVYLTPPSEEEEVKTAFPNQNSAFMC